MSAEVSKKKVFKGNNHISKSTKKTDMSIIKLTQHVFKDNQIGMPSKWFSFDNSSSKVINPQPQSMLSKSASCQDLWCNQRSTIPKHPVF